MQLGIVTFTSNYWRWLTNRIVSTRLLLLPAIRLNPGWEAMGHFSPCRAEITLLEKLLYNGLRRPWRNCEWCTLCIIHEAVENDNVIVALLSTHPCVWPQIPALIQRNNLHACKSLCANLHREVQNCHGNSAVQISNSNYLFLCFRMSDGRGLIFVPQIQIRLRETNSVERTKLVDGL